VNPLIVVEDNPSMQIRLRAILKVAVGMAGHFSFAGDLAEGCHMIAAQPYSLAVVDLGLIGEEGGEMVRRLHRYDSALPVIVLTARHDRQGMLAALRAGARGYLLKEREDIEIALSIRNVLNGGYAIDPFVARHILELVVAGACIQAMSGGPSPLSPRETEVLQLVAKGFANREVSSLLNLSKLTVECHIKNIYRKLEVKSRTQAVFEARAAGILP
jgi:DNA-binding NarL/FixJ family response regulator